MKNKKTRIDTIIWCSFIFLELFLVKYFQFNFLPAKYFYDSNKILYMVNYGVRYGDMAYDFTATIFTKINLFHFNSLSQWSYFLGIIFSILIFVLLLKNKKYTLKQYLFIYASIVLLNIYVFNISKDIIQFVIFLFIYLILKNEKFSNIKKILFICFILILESLFFRIYYAIMALMIISIWIIYKKFIYGKKLSKKTIFRLILLALFVFFLEIFLVSLISQNNYQKILYARYGVNSLRTNDMDANTIIIDLLGENTTFLKFILNYIINAFRLMFPIELFNKGLKYIPFIAYQLFLTYLIFKSSKRINEKNILFFITIISFLIISFIFEPDFGSFVRHESVIFLLYLELTMIENSSSKNKENELFLNNE